VPVEPLRHSAFAGYVSAWRLAVGGRSAG
jgi:hypothetical protein